MSTDRNTLKSYFQTGDIPTEAHYAELIESIATGPELETEKVAREQGDLIIKEALDIKIDQADARLTAIELTNTSDDTRLDEVEAWVNKEKAEELESFIFGCSAETGSIPTGDVFTFRMPYAFTLVDVRGSLTSAPAVPLSFTIKVNGTAITSSVTLGVGDKTTGITTGVLLGQNSPPKSIAMDDEVTVNVASYTGNSGAGLKASLVGYRGDCSVVGTPGSVDFPITFPFTFTQYSISCT